MATTTPNYGWDVPTSTDYVKDGATAIETLGDDIDASLFSITSGKNVGLVHIVTATVTANATLAVNNCFTSTFDNYRVIYRGTQNTAYGTQELQFTIAGTPTGTANFGYQGFGVFQNNSTAVVWSGGQVANNAAAYGANGASAGNRFSSVTEIYQPALADATFLHTQAWSQGTGAGTNTSTFTNGWNSYTAAGFDGFRINTPTGTMTGTISIYGYRKS
jgi:hypothetical protein